MMQIPPGTNIGAYRIIEQIGWGGMATVYMAYQPALARYVAIKVLPMFFFADEEARQRFQNEAIAIAKLRHPNILVVFDYGEQDGLAYLVGEFAEGGTLQGRLGKPFSVRDTVRILAPIASALDYAHGRSILHRDVKPSNILLTEDGSPLLADFGLAKILDSVSRFTRTGVAMGTPEYMAPEQAAGEPLGPAGDAYALAVVGYEMLTGRVPFSAETPLAVLLAHLHKALPLPRTINPDLPQQAEAVLLKGLAKDPADRYPSVTAFIEALAAADQEAATSNPSESGAASGSAGPSLPPAGLPEMAAVTGLAGAAIAGGLLDGGVKPVAAASTPPSDSPAVARQGPGEPAAGRSRKPLLAIAGAAAIAAILLAVLAINRGAASTQPSHGRATTVAVVAVSTSTQTATSTPRPSTSTP
ncbi:MAG TPA: serine/threonine-protein kinase, partial [Chloroflexota bacterium]|nr:serine/threonine-protein kinase [Chloroflexota bacterium]